MTRTMVEQVIGFFVAARLKLPKDSGPEAEPDRGRWR